jgi:DnaJ-class molecular chaperone
MEDGQVLRLKGDGHAGPRNGPRGDLLLRLLVEPDPVLRRHGADILMDLRISPIEATCGVALEVPTLRGPKQLRIPAGVGDRTVLRLGGAGLRLGSWRRGDQFVTVYVSESVRAEAATE